MKIKNYKFNLILFIAIIGFGCKKVENVDNRISFIYSNDKAQLINDSTVKLNMRFFPNSNNSENKPLLSDFFYVAPSNGYLSDSAKTISVNYNLSEISRIFKSHASAPYTFLVLVDKTITSITTDFNQTEYLGLETALINFYSKSSGYEINAAGFADGNPRMITTFQTASPAFVNNISQLDIDKLGFLFDVHTNAGKPDLYTAVDNALSYINANAKYPDRAILVLTDSKSIIADTAQMENLIKKSNSYHTSISILDTEQGFYVYTHLRMVSETGGMNCNSTSSGVQENGFDLVVAALNDYLTNGDYYESALEIHTNAGFGKVNWAIFSPYIKLYNENRYFSVEVIYEK